MHKPLFSLLILTFTNFVFAKTNCVENIMLVCRDTHDKSISASLCNSPEEGLIALLTDGEDSTGLLAGGWMDCKRLSEKLISCRGQWQASGRHALVVFKLGETDWDARAGFNRATAGGVMQSSCDPEVIPNL